jgi:hypothetical protein
MRVSPSSERASGDRKKKCRPQSGGFVVENFAFLPHRAEAQTTVLSKSVGRAFALS